MPAHPSIFFQCRGGQSRRSGSGNELGAVILLLIYFNVFWPLGNASSSDMLNDIEKEEEEEEELNARIYLIAKATDGLDKKV